MPLSRRHFEATPEAVGAARRFVVETVPAGWDEELVAAMALAVSEMTTNAVMHANTGFDVVITSNGRVRVGVEDGSAQPPIVRSQSALTTHGWGLRVLDAVCDRWGVNGVHGGKCVWCERDLPQGDLATPHRV